MVASVTVVGWVNRVVGLDRSCGPLGFGAATLRQPAVVVVEVSVAVVAPALEFESSDPQPASATAKTISSGARQRSMGLETLPAASVASAVFLGCP